MMSTARFGDIKPYAAPEGLGELSGPSMGGTLLLDHTISWAPGSSVVHLTSLDDVRFAYRAILSEGTVEQQRQLLNADLLIEVWPDLMLPFRVMQLWQDRFPELPAKEI
ncbi:transcriptional regulator [Actinomycetaceae bacterium L2_0104]